MRCQTAAGWLLAPKKIVVTERTGITRNITMAGESAKQLKRNATRIGKRYATRGSISVFVLPTYGHERAAGCNSLKAEALDFKSELYFGRLHR